MNDSDLRSHSPRILVVDDSAQNIDLVRTMLKSQNYEIFAAHDGMEALERAAEVRPDLILLDIIMPGMDGFEVARIMRSRPETVTVPILMLTALSGVEDKTRALEAGANDFLSKPVRYVELVARVSSHMRIKQLHDDLQAKNLLLEKILRRYVSEEVLNEILRDPKQNLKFSGQVCEVSVMFADLRGFTRFTERREAAQVVEMLNLVFDNLAPIVFEYDGTLDKYLGDAIMAFYGAPIPSSNNPEQAIRAAWKMQKCFEQLRAENAELGELGLGIGICAGEAVVGSIGTERKMDYTVIGSTPGTARRLEELAGAGQILVNKRAYMAVRDLFEANRADSVNGNGPDGEIDIYEVVGIKEPAPGS